MAKLNMAYLSSLKKPNKLLLSSFPVSTSRVLRAPGTSPYHLVPKHLWVTWPRPEQSHLLPETRPALTNCTDNRQQRQRRTMRPPPDPVTLSKDFTLYMTTNYVIMRKRCRNYNACVTHLCLASPNGDSRF